MAIEMAKELKFGKMAASMLDTGKMIKRLVKADSFMPMGMSTKESGSMTRLREEVFMNIWILPSMSATGKKIDSMVMV